MAASHHKSSTAKCQRFILRGVAVDYFCMGLLWLGRWSFGHGTWWMIIVCLRRDEVCRPLVFVAIDVRSGEETCVCLCVRLCASVCLFASVFYVSVFVCVRVFVCGRVFVCMCLCLCVCVCSLHFKTVFSFVLRESYCNVLITGFDSVTAAAPNLFRLADHCVNISRLADRGKIFREKLFSRKIS